MDVYLKSAMRRVVCFLLCFGLVFVRLSAQQTLSLSRGYNDVFLPSLPTTPSNSLALIPLFTDGWNRYASRISTFGLRFAFHYMPELRGMDTPVRLTEIEYFCTALSVAAPLTGCRDLTWYPVCHSRSLVNWALPSVGPRGFKPVLLIYEFPLGVADAKAANVRTRDYRYALVPTSDEMDTITTVNTGYRGYVVFYSSSRSYTCTSNELLRHNFVLPERFRIQLNPDRNYLLALTMSPRDNDYRLRVDWSDPLPEMPRVLGPIGRCSPLGEPNYAYVSEADGSFSCPGSSRPSLGFLPMEEYLPVQELYCRCNMSGNEYERHWGWTVKAERVVQCGADVDCNGCVDDSDLLAVLFNFGGGASQADVNNDGVVDDSDLLEVLFNFGTGSSC